LITTYIFSSNHRSDQIAVRQTDRLLHSVDTQYTALNQYRPRHCPPVSKLHRLGKMVSTRVQRNGCTTYSLCKHKHQDTFRPQCTSPDENEVPQVSHFYLYKRFRSLCIQCNQRCYARNPIVVRV